MKLINKKTYIAIFAVVLSISPWVFPLESNANPNEKEGFAEVCCGGDCEYNRCLNYGSYKCCV